ncbi:hypothetical protein EF876_03155 [Erysipelothrix rhusiopathiae]|nr:hypothetical protein [Erysipelothrix rhusiopathiae]RNM30876.1 hypothetical protein EF876_03155 [Erysipelothrix rhusiopathiae]
MEKNNKLLLILVFVLSIGTLSVGGFFAIQAWQTYQTTLTKATISNHSQYSLRNNATAYQKEVYEELASVESGSDALISELISKNFIADFYTWTNKVRMNDVGGIQFLHPDIKVWVYDQALDRFYNDMRVYIEREQVDQTLEVSGVDVTSTKTKFLLNDQEVPAYQVHATWTYKESTVLDTKNYQHEAQITVVKQNDTYSIVEVTNGTQNSTETKPA